MRKARKILSDTKKKWRSESRSLSRGSNSTGMPPTANVTVSASTSISTTQSQGFVSTSVPVVLQASASATMPSKADRTVRNIAIFRTVLSTAEKALDGLPVYGPKAAVAATAEVLKNMQLKIENDGSIQEIKEDGDRLGSMLTATSQELDSTVGISPKLKKRVDELQTEIESHLESLKQYVAFDTPQFGASNISIIKAWLRQTEETLSAEAIAKELPEVNGKIMSSLQKYMVGAQIRIENDVSLIRTHQIAQEDHSLLDRISPIKTAFHDDANAASGCLPGTRTALLETVTNWFDDDSPDSSLVMWLSGNAGTGKTTIAHSVCDLFKENLGAAFFFSRDEANRRRPTNVIPTIIYQLAYNRPALRRGICDAIKDDPSVSSKGLQPQADKLIAGALSEGLENQSKILLVLDALDECDKENGQEGGSLIPLLFGRLRELPFRVKVFITSRPEASIHTLFKNLTGHIRPFVLHDIEEHVVQYDIERYLRYAFAEISRVFLGGKLWPDEEVIKTLVTQAGRLFIYAATIVKYTSGKFPERKLERFLSARTHELGSSHSALDHVYTQIIRSVISDIEEVDVIYIIDVFKRVVGAIVTLQQPLGRNALSKLVGRPANDINEVLQPLYSLLEIGDLSQGKTPIRIFHPSFPDFISNQDRCPDARLRIDRAEMHPLLLSGCFSVMETQLKQDICRIGDPSLFNSEVPDLDRRLDEHISEELGYACTYWMVHLVEMADLPAELFQQLMRFCVTHLLHWVECLSLLRRLRSAAEGLPRVLAWLAQSDISACYYDEEEYALVTALIDDTLRVIREYWTPIAASALQVYHTALVFMPDCELYRVEKAKTASIAQLASDRHKGWDPCLQVLEGHTNIFDAIAFSPNNQHIVSSSMYGTIRIWNSSTGETSMTFKSDHNDYPRVIAYSLDGSRIFSGTRRGGIRALSVTDTTGAWVVISPDQSDSKNILFMAICPDGLRLAFIYQSECNVYVCNIKSCELVTLVGDEDNATSSKDDSESDEEATIKSEKRLLSVTFTQRKTGLYIVSASSEGTLYQWDIEQKGPPTVLSKDYFEATVAAFSPNSLSSYVVLGSEKGDIQIRDYTQSSRAPILLHGHISTIRTVCFSNDGSRVASGSDDYTVRLWEAITGNCLAVLEGHSYCITCVAFSSDGLRLASGSHDKTIRIWDAITQRKTTQTNGHTKGVRSVAFSADGSRAVSGSHDRTIRLWDTNTGNLIVTSEVNENPISSVAFLPNGSEIVFGDSGGRVKTWNVGTGEINSLIGQPDYNDVDLLASSHDGSFIVAVSEFRHVKIFSRTGKLVKVIFKSFIHVICIAFSPDNARLVLGKHDGSIEIWNILDTQPTQTLTLFLKTPILSAAFSSDNFRIITTSAEGVQVYYADTGGHIPAIQAEGADAELRDQSVFRYNPTTGWLYHIRTDIPLLIRLCWLPVSRRPNVYSPNAFSWFGAKVIIGGWSGLISILDFSSHPLFQFRATSGL